MRLGIIGAGGYWGQKLLLIASAMRKAQVTLCSAHSNMPRLMETLTAAYGTRSLPAATFSATEVSGSSRVDALVIASPAESHFTIAKDALLNGKHVFVEKPMCLSSCECRELANLASERGLVLFVDHTYLYSRCVQYMKEAITGGSIGSPLALYSNRTQIGIYRGQSVLWDLAPHDLSIIKYLFPAERIDRVSLRAWKLFPPGVQRVQPPDSVQYSISFDSGFQAAGFLTWCHPRLSRDIAVIGTEGMLLFESNQVVRVFARQDAQARVPSREAWRERCVYSPDDNPLKSALDQFCRLADGSGEQIPDHLCPQFGVDVVAAIELIEQASAYS